ncbi:PcfB family protein [Clostridium transplantifaecale]|uniref:PcfB family protein n=1 Tax=Clostridium transplantifaecale TaxID=2479838 RepID=UPI000F63EC1D|nr:PcfB family protein [Clostridium transplantifaecale]
MQEEVTQKTIALSIRATKLTADLLQKAIRAFLRAEKARRNRPKEGQQTLRQLKKHGKPLTNIEITDQNIKAFSSVAKEFQIDFALKKDGSQEPPHYLVFFKGQDKDSVMAAFEKFSAMTLKHEKKPSIRKLLSAMKEKAQQKGKQREKVKAKDRGVEL